MEAKSLDFKHICSLVFYFFFLKPLDKGLEKSPKTKLDVTLLLLTGDSGGPGLVHMMSCYIRDV